ncbi:hypothetical protein K505DRAFT_237415 [Melanomma pulvis-pyrius CBS 109.77]|uniref:Uncharacterized protein n=1 Tax=Melanomma pulvis-pyrius CBS 109.77 TaxID=1314802 RepID=A0A6A6XJD3_9PLEO|nr:hypothetical protein K505DRAFT_237415 [Melanomma pulvis-pyrius CBS 109.77]
MSRNEKDGLPSYSESLNTNSTGLSPIPTSRGPQILDQLTLVRAQHIRSVIDNAIIPLVEQQASYGIAQTIIAMIPSDVNLPAEEEKSEFSFDTATTKKVEVIGFSSDESPQIVRLEGQLNRTEFWRPQAIVEELEHVLRERLNASTRLRSPTRERFDVPATVKEVPHKQPKRGLFGRVVDVINQEGGGGPDASPVANVWQPESVGMVLVKARLEEICLRTVNDFGLYDTMSKQCVIIRVDARC